MSWNEKWERAQAQLMERSQQVRAVYEASGREGLKEYSGTDVGLFGMLLTHEIERLTEKIERGEGSAADLIDQRKLQAAQQDVAVDMRERVRNIER